MTSRTLRPLRVAGMLIALLATAVLVTAAGANEPEKRSMIPFPTLGGINDWRSDSDKWM